VVILALDGAWRAGYTPEEIVAELERKQAVNFAREWPPAKDVDPDQPSEHIQADTPPEAATVRRPPMEAFEKELTQLINRYSIESMADMPDFLLAGMICRIIEAMGPSIKSALDWHGCDSVCHPAPIVGGEECDPDEESPPAPCNGQCSQTKADSAVRRIMEEGKEKRGGRNPDPVKPKPDNPPPPQKITTTGKQYPEGSPCPICGKPVRAVHNNWFGRHYALECETHGVVGMIRHPLCPQPQSSRGLFARLRDWLCGTPNKEA